MLVANLRGQAGRRCQGKCYNGVGGFVPRGAAPMGRTISFALIISRILQQEYARAIEEVMRPCACTYGTVPSRAVSPSCVAFANLLPIA